MYLHQLQIRYRHMASPSVRHFLVRGMSIGLLHIAAGKVEQNVYDALRTLAASQAVAGFSLVVS